MRATSSLLVEGALLLVALGVALALAPVLSLVPLALASAMALRALVRQTSQHRILLSSTPVWHQSFNSCAYRARLLMPSQTSLSTLTLMLQRGVFFSDMRLRK